MNTAINRIAAWIALLAILLAALVPAFSHAVMPAKIDVAAMHEICTADGSASVRQMPHEAEHRKLPADESLHAKHCPYCATNAASFALLPPSFSLPVMSGGHIIPSLFYQSSRPLTAWAVAQPRAPPAFS